MVVCAFVVDGAISQRLVAAEARGLAHRETRARLLPTLLLTITVTISYLLSLPLATKRAYRGAGAAYLVMHGAACASRRRIMRVRARAHLADAAARVSGCEKSCAR